MRFYPLYSFRKNLNKRQYEGKTLIKGQYRSSQIEIEE